MNIKHILLLSFAHLANDINAGALPALLPYLATAHNLDYQACGTLTFAYAFISSLVQPLFGLYADKKNFFWFVPLGIILSSFSMSLIGFLSSYNAILCALIICGIGSAIFHPEGTRYANKISQENKALGISIFIIGGNSGTFIGPLIITLMVSGVSISSYFKLGGFGLSGTLFFAIFGLIIACLLYFSMYNLINKNTIISQNKTTNKNNDWLAFSILTIPILSRSILFFSFNTFLPLYWISVFGETTEIANMILVIFCLTGLIANFFGGTFADKIGNIKALKIFFPLSLPFVAIFPFITNQWLALLCLLPIVIGCYAVFSPMIVLGQNYLAKNIGFASGITLGVSISIGGMSIPILGYIADNYGGLTSVMHIMVLIVIIGSISVHFLPEIPKSHKNN